MCIISVSLLLLVAPVRTIYSSVPHRPLAPARTKPVGAKDRHMENPSIWSVDHVYCSLVGLSLVGDCSVRYRVQTFPSSLFSFHMSVCI